MKCLRDDPRTVLAPIVMLTSANESSKEVLEFKGVLNSCVRKPLHYRDFQEKLDKVRKYWHLKHCAADKPRHLSPRLQRK